MAVVKQVVATSAALTVTGLSTLASATYVSSAVYNCTTNQPLDVVVSVSVATTNTPSGNKQVVVFLQESIDGGTTYRSGPGSGTTTTDESNLRYMGAVPIATASTTEVGMFSVFAALGYMPTHFKVVIKNDLGATLTSGSAATAEISNTVV